MSARLRVALRAGLWCCAGLPAAAQSAPAAQLRLVEELEGDWTVVAARLVDMQGSGRVELLVVGADGSVARHVAAQSQLLSAAGRLVLDDPAHALLDVAALDPGRNGVQILWANPRGTFLWGLTEDGAGFAAAATPLAARARMPYRTGVPRFAELAQDVNRDGRSDIVLPVIGACELWLNMGPGQEPGQVSLRKSARVALDIRREVENDGRRLSDVLESSISVPNLTTRDVSGDGRPDLLVVDGTRRSFFLQNEEGGFPAEPSVVLDLSIFRDSGATGGIKPGQTLSLEGTATYESRDLDGDGIPDYVVAHGRKVWVFLGSASGPQFTAPLSILKTAEDVTALTLARLDEDRLPDLVLFKVQVPTVATLLRGLFGEWDVQIGAAGYRNLDGKGFESTPSSRAELVVRLPSIVRVLKNPAELLTRFEELQSRFRTVVRGDLDGDGQDDLGLVTSDGRRLEVWLGRSGGRAAALDADRALREVFFESSDTVWDLDRILMWIGGVADRQVALETGGRESFASFALREDASLRLETLEAGDLDGDGRAELVLGYRPAEGVGRARFDVLRLESTGAGGK
jgi:hypothetical protein